MRIHVLPGRPDDDRGPALDDETVRRLAEEDLRNLDPEGTQTVFLNLTEHEASVLVGACQEYADAWAGQYPADASTALILRERVLDQYPPHWERS